MYGVLKRLDGGIPPRREGESLEQAHARIVECWDQLSEMRRAMRQSLGLSLTQPDAAASDHAVLPSDDMVRGQRGGGTGGRS